MPFCCIGLTGIFIMIYLSPSLLFNIFLKSALKTIKDSYFSSACAKPSLVFPKVLLLSAKHLEKDEYAVRDRILVGEIMDKLEDEFPSTLPLDEQGKFIIGYYQQMQFFYKKKETNGEEVNHEEEEL